MDRSRFCAPPPISSSMETPISSSSSSSSSAVGDGHSPGAGAREGAAGPSEAPARMTMEDLLRGDQSYYQRRGYPDVASYLEARKKMLLSQFLVKVAPMLRPILNKDSLPRFYGLCNGWSQYMGLREFLYPEILTSMVSKNAVRCARAALQGGDWLRGRRADPNGCHPYGFMPLHVAAETFSVQMVKLLLRHGASANLRTKGEQVIEDLLPLHVAVENTSMHKYLEDHWADGHPLDTLIALLCLPEMKMYLDTTRLIAQHTHNIVDEVWNYIDKKQHVQLAILLLAAQKQLHGPLNRSKGKVSLNGFESVKSRTYEAIRALHHQMITMVNEGKNGSELKKLKQKKEALLTADTLVGIVEKAGQALEDYIQTCSEVCHEQILEHVSSILNSKGIVPSGIVIDTASLKCYQYPGQTSIAKPDSRVDTGGTNEADKSYTLNSEGFKRIPAKQPPKGLAIKEERDKFFPYWKAVLSARLQVKMLPPCEPSRKDIQRTEPRPSKSMGNLVFTSRSRLASNYECRRQLCDVASMALKVFRRT